MWDLGERAFRARLAREIAAWRAEGVVDEATARALEARYAPDHEGGRSLATLAVYLLGALLIGGGVLSLVAWNWEALPGSAKLLMGAAALTAAHLYGFRMWRVDGGRPRLGHALTVLGTLIFGADIGLVAQVFHISGAWYNGFLAWGVGALAAALAYASAPHAAVALITGYVGWWGLVDLIEPTAPALIYLFPLIFLPIAWRLDSRLLFFLTVVAWGVALPAAVGEASNDEGLVFLAICAVAGACLAYTPSFRLEGAQRFGPLTRALGVATFVGVAYAFSFHDLSDELAGPWEADRLTWIATCVPFALVALGLGRGLAGGVFREAPVGTVALIAVPALTTAGLVGGMPLTVVANLTLVALSAVAITTAVEGLERGPFWLGSLLGAVLVVTRFLEFDTDLWIKALAFIAAGVTLLAVGVAFERRLKSRPKHVG